MTERKILFRGFQPDENGKTTITLNGKKFNGDWLYWNKWGECINIENGALILLPAQGFECLRVNKFNILRETVGQWVITNRYHKDIFEGDNVAFYGDYIHTGVVEWNESNAQFVVVDEDGDWDLIDTDWEVIGNKWESEVTDNE